MSRSKLLVFAVVAIMVAAFFALDAGRYLSLEFFRAQHEALVTYYRSHPLAAAVGCFAAYVAVTGLSLPGAADAIPARAGSIDCGVADDLFENRVKLAGQSVEVGTPIRGEHGAGRTPGDARPAVLVLG